ncbi:Porin P precursor [Novipirellula aureliae]|uniref:Porin P n=1 Tax=Novipirellula aureliae TaxID=2527966 RepID=A0A5C6DCW4_9BACT|nr:porin [Novipirellula aureliae]TWU34538.1 Porin P precursor [Novipirellula aureliae]
MDYRNVLRVLMLAITGIIQIPTKAQNTGSEDLGIQEIGLLAEGVPDSGSIPSDVRIALDHMQRQIDAINAPVIHCAPAPAKPEFPAIRVSGFFQADTAWFDQDAANIIAVGDVQDGADFRRARLQAIGSVAENVDFSVEFDFGFPGRPSFMDVWLDVQDLSILQNVKVGLYRQPFGLDALTSVRELTFIERALPFAFVPFRQIGAMAHGSSKADDITWAVSGFRFPTDFNGGNIGDNGGYGLATRWTGLLIDNGDCAALHLGGAYCLIDPSNDAVQYRSQPEIFIAETGGAAFVPAGVPSTVPPFVDTGVIENTDLTNLFSAELATTIGSFHAQSEVIYSTVDRSIGSTVGFSGFSAQAAYILTGEHRPYNKTNGVLGRITPRNNFGKDGWGAWEATSRYSYLDLNDDDIQGGRLNDVTLGLNWYLNNYTKFQANYIHAMLDSPVNGDSDADIVAMRAQVDF